MGESASFAGMFSIPIFYYFFSPNVGSGVANIWSPARRRVKRDEICGGNGISLGDWPSLLSASCLREDVSRPTSAPPSAMILYGCFRLRINSAVGLSLRVIAAV